MATLRKADIGWRRALRSGRERRISAAEQARRRAETRRLLAFRDGLPPIAPDTTGQYLHELRAEDALRESAARPPAEAPDRQRDADGADPVGEVVVDASVAPKCVLRDEEDADRADALLHRYDAGTLTLYAPRQIEVEVAAALRKAVLNRRLPAAVAERALALWLGPFRDRLRWPTTPTSYRRRCPERSPSASPSLTPCTWCWRRSSRFRWSWPTAGCCARRRSGRRPCGL
jgi:hypothetical protein